jgi:hypothetical protein
MTKHLQIVMRLYLGTAIRGFRNCRKTVAVTS